MMRNYGTSDSETETDWEEEIIQNTEHLPTRSSASSKSYAAPSFTFRPLENHPNFPITTFGEIECGEPQRAQQLFFDFTPNTELDTPGIREKVMDFFEFINAQKDIAHLCKIPDTEVDTQTKEVHKPKVEDTTDPYSSVDYCNKPVAQDLLEKYKACVSHLQNTSIKVETYPVSDDETISEESPRKGPDGSKKATIKKHAKLCAKNMCKTLEEWDKKHHKSMDPPGPVIRHHAIQQRIQPRERNY